MVDRIVTIDKESGLVRLIHYTAQEYFDRNPIIALLSAQEKITKNCVSYLLLGDIALGPCRNNTAMLKRFESKPFLRYAATKWGIHARGEPELTCRKTILLLTYNKEARASAFQASRVIIDRLWNQFYRGLDGREYTSQLMFAASFGLTNIVKYLLARDEDVKASDSNGTTALGYAATGGHTDTVEVLLAAGADIDRTDADGKRALTMAIRNDHKETVVALARKGANLQAGKSDRASPLSLAVSYNHVAMVSLLLEQGVNVEDDREALRSALFNHNVILVEKILDQMSREQQHSVIKTSLIDYLDSYYNQSSTVCNLLLQKGADINLCNSAGRSQLHIAAEYGLRDIAELLLDHGMDPDIKDRDGSTPLHLAAFRSLPTIELLLQRGASINAQNHAGQTALHYCVRGCWEPCDYYTETLSCLLKSGISLDITDSVGRTSLHIAANRGLQSAVRLMVEKGADRHAKDSEGRTALQVAVAEGHEHILDILTCPAGCERCGRI